MRNAVKIALATLFLVSGLTGCAILWHPHETYTQIGSFTFTCTEIARQPSVQATGGYDEKEGIYWSGMKESLGYAYMQTADKSYGFYYMISPTNWDNDPVQADDISPMEALVLQDSQGKLVYIDSEDTLKRYEEGDFAKLNPPYYTDLPSE